MRPGKARLIEIKEVVAVKRKIFLALKLQTRKFTEWNSFVEKSVSFL